MTTLDLCLGFIAVAFFFGLFAAWLLQPILSRRAARRHAQKLSRLFESGLWPEPGTIQKGEVRR